MLLDILQSQGDWSVKILTLMIILPAMLISLSCHEFAHAFASYKQGDSYARYSGRMTLNPFKHVDPFGFLSLILLGFGWAKPVPVVPSNFKNGKRSELIVALAGIIANLFLAVVAIFLFNFCRHILFRLPFFATEAGALLASILYLVFEYLAFININLAVFNLLPVPPLDGYRVFKALFERKIGYTFFVNVERYSTFISLALILLLNRTTILSTVSGALFDGINTLVGYIFIGF